MVTTPPAGDRGHTFGGAWTEVKLGAVSDYCGYFNKVLANKPSTANPFQRWYFDAFAGSGTRRVTRAIGGLWDGKPAEEERIDLAGSVLKALEIDPPFHRLAFIEGHGGRFRSLETIRTAHPERGIVCMQGDANQKLKEIFGAPPWSLQRQGRGSCRGLCFLDPYGMAVDWSTLALLAGTRAVDVWYLFPLDAVSRQLAGNLSRVDAHKQRRLDQIFGTTTWRDDVYQSETTPDLFAATVTTTTRTFDRGQIERYAMAQLGSIFRYVSEPLPLLNDGGRQIFSLFCLSNSASDRAITLIRKGVAWVLKKHGSSASRHKSGH
jgi:three-Cys-motif partner protein